MVKPISILDYGCIIDLCLYLKDKNKNLKLLVLI